MNSKTKRLIFDSILFCILIIIDRVTKSFAVDTLKENGPISIIDNVLELYYLPNGNTGAAFGMLEGHRILFLVIAFIVVAAIIYLAVAYAFGYTPAMIDRLISGYVVDFIYISCINFPIFNVADMYVSICTTVLAIIVLFVLKEDDYALLEESFTAPFKKRSGKKGQQ